MPKCIGGDYERMVVDEHNRTKTHGI
jgi:hypothetical protein